jgi:hypothetical protein
VGSGVDGKTITFTPVVGANASAVTWKITTDVSNTRRSGCHHKNSL